MKKVKLTDEDRCAIDLILADRANSKSGLENCFGKPSASLQKRVKKVGQVFDLLGQMPAEDPAASLAAQTLKFVEQHENNAVPAAITESPRPAMISSHATGAHRSLHS